MLGERNYKGELIENIQRELSDPLFGTGKLDKNGQPEVNWEYYIIGNADENGFDMQNVESNGYYYIEVGLPMGKIILRYGNESGHYTAPAGTPYEKLALPYKKETIEYNEYRVVADGISVVCLVNKGKVAASRDSKGQGIQYYHKDTIKKLVGKKVLERINLWGWLDWLTRVN